MDVRLGELASTGTTADTIINVTDLVYTQPTYYIVVVTGTLKVGRKTTPTTSHPFPAGSKIPISCLAGELCVKQGANGDNWVITA